MQEQVLPSLNNSKMVIYLKFCDVYLLTVSKLSMAHLFWEKTAAAVDTSLDLLNKNVKQRTLLNETVTDGIYHLHISEEAAI